MQEKQSNQQILFLTDEQLRLGVEAMFFAYRGFTSDPDKILEKHSYGRAHHRALHFINSCPGTTVNHLINILGVTKQSLNRVLRMLIDDGLVQVDIGKRDNAPLAQWIARWSSEPDVGGSSPSRCTKRLWPNG